VCVILLCGVGSGYRRVTFSVFRFLVVMLVRGIFVAGLEEMTENDLLCHDIYHGPCLKNSHFGGKTHRKGGREGVVCVDGLFLFWCDCVVGRSIQVDSPSLGLFISFIGGGGFSYMDTRLVFRDGGRKRGMYSLLHFTMAFGDRL